jgi:hypothetical protein
VIDRVHHFSQLTLIGFLMILQPTSLDKPDFVELHSLYFVGEEHELHQQKLLVYCFARNSFLHLVGLYSRNKKQE